MSFPELLRKKKVSKCPQFLSIFLQIVKEKRKNSENFVQKKNEFQNVLLQRLEKNMSFTNVHPKLTPPPQPQMTAPLG